MGKGVCGKKEKGKKERRGGLDSSVGTWRECAVVLGALVGRACVGSRRKLRWLRRGGSGEELPVVM